MALRQRRRFCTGSPGGNGEAWIPGLRLRFPPASPGKTKVGGMACSPWASASVSTRPSRPACRRCQTCEARGWGRRGPPSASLTRIRWQLRDETGLLHEGDVAAEALPEIARTELNGVTW